MYKDLNVSININQEGKLDLNKLFYFLIRHSIHLFVPTFPNSYIYSSFRSLSFQSKEERGNIKEELDI